MYNILTEYPGMEPGAPGEHREHISSAYRKQREGKESEARL